MTPMKRALLLLSMLALAACSLPELDETGSTSEALGGISFVQFKNTTPSTSPTSLTAKFPSAQVAGDTNIVPICWFNASSNVSSVTDTKGNVYAVAAPVVRLSGTASCTMYYAPHILAATANSNTTTRPT